LAWFRWVMPSSGATRGRRLLKRVILAAASRIPPPRDEALVRLATAARDLIIGRAVSSPSVSSRKPTAATSGPTRPVRQLAVNQIHWKTPPEVSTPGRAIRSVSDVGEPSTRYDLELLERFNEEYATKRIVTDAPRYDPDSLINSARRRVVWVHNEIDLMNKRTLEIGCGNGFEAWHTAHHFDADSHGVDVTEYAPWEALAGERVDFRCADLAASNPYPADYFDRVMSFTVWEHVRHPHRLLQQTYRILKPGGLCWLYANLYAGPSASHRYRDFSFPWPHLLFSDEVAREWDRKHGKPERGFAWVNRLSWRHYEFYFAEVGFELCRVRFMEKRIDEAFYSRFEDVLGRFPRSDLTKDYFIAVLRKPGQA
jgi:SAM-dependent methyltransferase